MKKMKVFPALIALFTLSWLIHLGDGLAAEKVKLATLLKTHPLYALPMLAAEEKGIWKEEGLEVSWIPFQGAGPFYRAAAAGAIDMGMAAALGTLHASIRGVPVIIVASLKEETDFYIWVLKESKIKEPKELWGAKIGTSSLGGASHLYGRAVTKALGLEKEVKFLALGSTPAELAAFKVGRVDAESLTLYTMATLKVRGEARELVAVKDYLPRPWVEQVLMARKEVTEAKGESVRKAISGFLKSARVVVRDRPWSLEKMVSFSGYPREAAEYLFGYISYSETGRTDLKAIANVARFMVEYGLVPEEKVPSSALLFTNNFVR